MFNSPPPSPKSMERRKGELVYIFQVFQQGASAFSDASAALCEGRQVTYRALNLTNDRTAYGLRLVSAPLCVSFPDRSPEMVAKQVNQVFFDSSGQRWAIVRRLLQIVVPVVAVLLIGLGIRLSSRLELPHLSLPPQHRASHPLIEQLSPSVAPPAPLQLLSMPAQAQP